MNPSPSFPDDQTASQTGEFVKASAIAKLYGVTSATAYRWAAEGKIPSLKFQGTTRFDLAAVRAVIEGGSQNPSNP